MLRPLWKASRVSIPRHRLVARRVLTSSRGRWPVKRAPTRPAKPAEALNALCLSDVAGRNSAPILRPSLEKTSPTLAQFALCASSVQLLKTREAASNSARTWAETETAPRISPRGRALISTRRPLVNGDLQLRMGSGLRTALSGSLADSPPRIALSSSERALRFRRVEGAHRDGSLRSRRPVAHGLAPATSSLGRPSSGYAQHPSGNLPSARGSQDTTRPRASSAMWQQSSSALRS